MAVDGSLLGSGTCEASLLLGGQYWRLEMPFAAAHESVSDAVDGSSTGTSVPWMWALLRLPRFRGASDADDNDNRFRHRKVGFPGSRRRRWRPGDCSQAIEASLCTDLLPEAIAMSGRYRSLRVCSPL